MYQSNNADLKQETLKKIEQIDNLIANKSSIDHLVDNELRNFSKIDKFYCTEDIDDLIPIDARFPGSIIITVDPMEMTAMLELKDSINCDCGITMIEVENKIKEMGTFFYNRVKWETVIRLYNSVFSMHNDEPATLIAEGLAVTPYIPEHIQIKESLKTTFNPRELNNGKVDYHTINAFLFVKKGEHLGDIIPEQIGTNGRTLTGNIMKFPTIEKKKQQIGPNIKVIGDKIYSEIDGTFKENDEILKVESCLRIHSDIDYHTGNIDYKGDIEINGTVREGFDVSSQGDIFVNGCIEPSNITAANNIFVKEGLLGSEETTITCEGSLYSNHIENAYIKTKGAVNVRNCMVHSIILTQDYIHMPKKGAIVGCFLCAQNRAVLGNIGNENNLMNEIYLGKDHEAELKLRKVRNTINEFQAKMSELQKMIWAAKSRQERDQIKDLYLSLKEKVDGLGNVSRVLLEEVDKNDGAILEVYGTVYPGTRIDICNIKLNIQKKMHNIRFSLNKKRGEIECEHI